eukprot:scaffold13783_cov41-Phaeocystis_antarctica.AAC.2
MQEGSLRTPGTCATAIARPPSPRSPREVGCAHARRAPSFPLHPRPLPGRPQPPPEPPRPPEGNEGQSESQVVQTAHGASLSHSRHPDTVSVWAGSASSWRFWAAPAPRPARRRRTARAAWTQRPCGIAISSATEST